MGSIPAGASWAERFPLVESLENCNEDFYFIESEFYGGLQSWLEEQFEGWLKRKLQSDSS